MVLLRPRIEVRMVESIDKSGRKSKIVAIRCGEDTPRISAHLPASLHNYSNNYWSCLSDADCGSYPPQSQG